MDLDRRILAVLAAAGVGPFLDSCEPADSTSTKPTSDAPGLSVTQGITSPRAPSVHLPADAAVPASRRLSR